MTTILSGFTIPIFTSPIPKCTPLRIDYYDFYAISDLFDTSFIYMFSLQLNLAPASMSVLVFHLAHEWKSHLDDRLLNSPPIEKDTVLCIHIE